MFADSVQNAGIVTPFLIVAVWGIILMFIDLNIKTENRHVTAWLSLVGLVPALLITFLQWNSSADAFLTSAGTPMVVLDNFGTFLNALYLITGILAVMMSIGYVKSAGIARGEFYFLMLFSICGMMLMGMAADLVIVFLALELLSIPLYILSGFNRTSAESEESALKYFLLGAFSSGFLVFGIALIYGATGSTALSIIAANISGSGAIGMTGVAMLLVGFGFKVGSVPFHMWTPDVYEGAPTAVTAFMSVGAKLGGFAAMIRVFAGSFESISADWAPAIAVLAAITMIVGNVSAITQTNIKRMLAYSSIAHAGYIMMGLATGRSGVSAALYYMMTYLFTNLAAFALVMAMERFSGQEGLLLDDYKGLAKRNPKFALVLMYIMLSLTGIPLTGGFTGKFYIFQTAVESGLIWLAVVGALTSVISAFYYLRPVYNAFMFEGPGQVQSMPTGLSLAIGITTAVTLILGFFPTPWYAIAEQALLPAIRAVAGG
ncbi:MAG: NADH-quinone oxidoreductase subunit N [Candidatus Promineifilaceae bacterium]